jgi:hypothetical protein
MKLPDAETSNVEISITLDGMNYTITIVIQQPERM